MIERYTLPEMGSLWSEEAKFRGWLEVEIAACQANAELGRVPAEAMEQIRQRAAFSVPRILEIEAAFTSATPTTQVEVEIQPFAPADRTDFPAWEVASPAIIEETAQKKKAFPSAPPIVIPLTVPGDGQLRTHTLNLADNPAYRGAMKQLRLRLPATDGTADVRRIELRR